jgi:outer membrane protein OmpA-like peptidoglycan-associated protein
MKKHALVAAILAAALFAPGFAHAYPKQGWYVGGAGGLNILEDTEATNGGSTDKLTFNPGFTVSGSAGFGFENHLRPEFELSFRRNLVDEAKGPTSGPASTGHFNTTAFMGNLFYDFDTRSGFTPYIGAGVGGALISADQAGQVFSGDTIKSTPFMFAYQGIAGAAFELSENLDFTVDYRYFRTLSPDFKTAAGLKVDDASYASHNVMIGLRYVFGIQRALPQPVAMRETTRAVQVFPMQPMAPPPMMMQPMAPPPPPMVQAYAPPPPMVPETYIVFFDFDKYYLTPEAKETLSRAAEAFKAGGNAHVEVTGHTDTSGSYRYNKRLSERRARTVKEYMVALGIPANEIGTRGAGEAEPMVSTGNNVREAKNRRAEVVMR